MVSTPEREAEAAARFPAEISSALAARQFVVEVLERWGCTGWEEVARLLVSELVTNVLLHAGTSLEVRMNVADGVLRVEVHDLEPSPPDRKYYPWTSTTGRGLLLVEVMARRWGTEPTSGGKVVWFELDEADGPAGQPSSPLP